MKPAPQSQPERLDRIVSFVAGRLGMSPAALESAAEVEDRESLQAKRLEMGERRKALLAESTTSASVLQERKAAAERRAPELRRILDDTRRALDQIAVDVLDVGAEAFWAELARDRELTRLNADLEATADPRITAAIRDLRREESELMYSGLAFVERKNRWTDEVRQTSNLASVTDRLAALRRAIGDAERLRLEPLTADEVEERLAALRAGLPGMEGIAPTGPGWDTAWAGVVVGAVRRGPRPAPTPPKGGWWKPRRG